MPYVRCPCCALRTFTAASWSTVEHCVRCDTPLPRHPAGHGGPPFAPPSPARLLAAHVAGPTGAGDRQHPA